MTSKDFELIAEVIARAERVRETLRNAPGGKPDYAPSVEFFADLFAEVLSERHPRFNVGKFLHAALPISAERKKQEILQKLGQAS